MSKKMLQEVSRRFRLLGDPMRLQILQALESGEQSVNGIVKTVRATQPNVSKHLKTLTESGLLGKRRAGLNTFYFIADPVVFQLCDLVCSSTVKKLQRDLNEFTNSGKSR